MGAAFWTKVYENALAYEIRKSGFQVKQQEPIVIRYDAVVVGDYIADLIVENRILLELRAVKDFDQIHMAQRMNDLKATGLKHCLLMNFAKPKVQIKRIVD